MTSSSHKCYLSRRTVAFVVATFIIVAFTCIVTFIVYGLNKRSHIQSFDHSFQQLTLGDTAEKVIEIMGSPDRVLVGENKVPFPEVPQDSEHASTPGKIPPVIQFYYSVNTLFLPVSWIVSFDRDLTIVSKFKLD
jgi:hypothetical protein